MHPIQNIKDFRFQGNAIVRYLLDEGPYDLNHIARLEFSQEDREQFAQLISYSLSGFSELSYVSEEAIEAADKIAEGKLELQARNEVLRDKLHTLRQELAEPMAKLFNIHPDDLTENP